MVVSFSARITSSIGEFACATQICAVCAVSEAHLQCVKFDAANRFVFSNRYILGERVEAHVQRERITMLVHGPLAAVEASNK